MRNRLDVSELVQSLYVNEAVTRPLVPTIGLPKLLPVVRPVHAVVKVDVFVPGCPPSAETIFYVVSELLAGRVPDVSAHTRFGA
jgi:NAD-reducing hydrogenase small subunit